MRPVRLALDLAGIDKGRIDDIICIGSNTKIPRIRQQLEEFFGKPIYHGLDPDEAVAMGAATMAAILDGQIHGLALEEIKPLGIGVGVGGGPVVHVIDRCELLPISKTWIFTTEVDNQTEIQVDVYEGHKWTPNECHLIGTFTISGLKPAPRGQIQVPVIFTVDRNGILSVHAGKKELTIEKGRLTATAIEEMVTDTLNFAAIEEERRKQLAAKDHLEAYLVRAQNLLGRAKDGVLSPMEEKGVSQTCIEVCRWLDKESHSEAGYERRLEQLKKEIEPLLSLITISDPSIDNK